MTLEALLAITPAEWTRDRREAVGVALRAALAKARTVRVTLPCTTADEAAYWTAVLIGGAKRQVGLGQQLADVIHTCGRVWDGQTLKVTWSGWPKIGDADFEAYQDFLEGRAQPAPSAAPETPADPVVGERILGQA